MPHEARGRPSRSALDRVAGPNGQAQCSSDKTRAPARHAPVQCGVEAASLWVRAVGGPKAVHLAQELGRQAQDCTKLLLLALVLALVLAWAGRWRWRWRLLGRFRGHSWLRPGEEGPTGAYQCEKEQWGRTEAGSHGCTDGDELLCRQAAAEPGIRFRLLGEAV